MVPVRSKESKKEKLPREKKEATVQKPEAKKEYKDRLEEHTEDECEHGCTCTLFITFIFHFCSVALKMNTHE